MRFKLPKSQRPSKIPVARRFGQRLYMDLFFIPGSPGTKFALVGIVCDGTLLHVAVLADNREAETLMICFRDGWCRPFGAPDEMVLDQEGGFNSGLFTHMAAELSIQLIFVPAAAHWQLGRAESQNYALA